jgi:hypothetical protein
MKIIQESDDRYKLLDKIYSYNFTSISIRYPDGYLDYFIPPELVLKDANLGDSIVHRIESYNVGDNLVYPNKLSILLTKTCSLTVQELFDLTVLHINDTEDRPKCAECGIPIKFSGEFQRGYSRHHWLDNPSRNLFCNYEHSTYYMHHHLDEYPHMIYTVDALSSVGNDPLKQIKAAYKRSLQYEDLTDESSFYVAFTSDGFKFGISIDSGSRMNHLDCRSFKALYLENYKVCLLEYLIKIKLFELHQLTSEYVPDNLIKSFKSNFKKFYQKIINLTLEEFNGINYKITNNTFVIDRF